MTKYRGLHTKESPLIPLCYNVITQRNYLQELLGYSILSSHKAALKQYLFRLLYHLFRVLGRGPLPLEVGFELRPRVLALIHD